MIDIIAGILVLVGAAFALIAAIGVARMPDLYVRMHAATKAGTLGAGLILLALALHAEEVGVILRAVAGIFFLLLTAPIAAHLLGRAAYCTGVTLWKHSVRDDLHGRYAPRTFILAGASKEPGLIAQAPSAQEAEPVGDGDTSK